MISGQNSDLSKSLTLPSLSEILANQAHNESPCRQDRDDFADLETAGCNSACGCFIAIADCTPTRSPVETWIATPGLATWSPSAGHIRSGHIRAVREVREVKWVNRSRPH